jgi:predicted ATPase
MIKNAAPSPTNPFVGRKSELTDICTRLTHPECRLLTITGLGGSGKTRLAIEAAEAVAGQFQHGVVFVGLQPLTRSDLLVTTIVQAVGLIFLRRRLARSAVIQFSTRQINTAAG